MSVDPATQPDSGAHADPKPAPKTVKGRNRRRTRSAALRQLEPLIRERGILPAAKDAGVSAPNLHRWFRGDQQVNDAQLDRLAKAVGCRVVIVPIEDGEGAQPPAQG